MKFTVLKSDILDVLSKVQGLTGRKTNLAITTNVLIKTEDSSVSISATDLETGFEGYYPAKVDTPGTVALNARKLFEIVRNFPSDEIKFKEVENRWIEIGNQHVEYHIVGMNPEDFPDIPTIEDISFFEIDAIEFQRMIDKTVHIQGASEDKRAHIIGVYFERISSENEKMVRIISTDGSRLSKVDYQLGKEDDFPVGNNVLIPKKGLTEVGKFLTSEGSVRVGIKESHFVSKKDNETLIVRLLEGDFPPYQEIIEFTEGHEIVTDRAQFLMMLKRMSIVSSENYKSVMFNFKSGKLTITATNPEIGESKEDLEIPFEADPIEVAFNPKFFIDSLNVIEEEKAVIKIVNEEKPCLLEGLEDKSYLSVIMPMRI